MSERIGDYIHFGYKHYLEHGTSIDGPKSSKNVIQIASEHKKIIKQFVTTRTKQKKTAIQKTLEQQLNFFYGARGSIDELGYTDAEWKQIQQLIIQTFETTMQRDHPNLDLGKIDYNTLSAYVASQQLQPVVSSTSQALGKKETYTWTDAIETRIHQLDEALHDALDPKNSFMLSQQSIDRIKKIEQEYKVLYEEIQNISSSSRKTSRRKFVLSGNSRNQNFIKELNSLIGRVKYDRLTHIQGYLGEYIPAITQYVIRNYAKLKAEEIVEKDFIQAFKSKGIVVGDEGSARLLRSDRFIGTEKEQAAFALEDINMKVANSYKQDKVDIILEGPDGEKIPISAKNTNLNSPYGINLLKGSSLLKMLQDYPAFANHYANVTASHTDKSPSSIDLNAMHQAMKITMAAYALAGGMYGRNKQTGQLGYSQKAEFLLVNDNAKGQFKIYSIQDLISTLMTNIELLDIKGYDNPKWDNDWVGDRDIPDAKAAYRRAMAIIAEMHSIQYEISLSKEALNPKQMAITT